MVELKKKNQWVNWILFTDPDDPDKPKKCPKNPQNYLPAKVNDETTWGTFEKAQAGIGKIISHRNYIKGKDGKQLKDENGNSVYKDYQCEIVGVGFMFADGICGIDIDNKKDNPDFDRQAETIINLMDTYTEKSPSGKGYHIVFKCDMPKLPLDLTKTYFQKNGYNDLECYAAGFTNRYFTYTGNAINDKPIEERTEQFIIFLNNYMLRTNFEKEKQSYNQSRRSDAQTGNLTDEFLLEKARNEKGSKFSALFDYGDLSYNQNDWSRADLALCNKIAFYWQGDFNAIDRIFRRSALMRPKWNEIHGADTYGNNTINQMLSEWDGKCYTPPGRPKKEKKQKEYIEADQEYINNATDNYGVIDDEKITIAGVAFYLEQQGITIKYNEITRKVNITGLEKYNSNYIVDSFPVIAYNDLNLLYKKCSINVVQDFIKVITMNNAYNPVLEMIDNGKWDGQDRLEELYKIMKLENDDNLSKTLIYKWLWQNISMLRNNKGEYGADGLLVLKGGQGIGKTSFARKMALKNEWFSEGTTLDVRNKDSITSAGSCWICELGEIESTFKADINALKGFITKSVDKYRVPYGRTDEDFPRRTSFIGTCNSDEYLIDETGNRRFWTIPLNDRMDLNALAKFDALQLYLQVNESSAKNNVQDYRLTIEENEQLTERNSRHEKSIKAELEIRDILLEVADQEFKTMTVSNFQKAHSSLSKFDVRDIGKALRKIGIKPHKTNKGAVYSLPSSKNSVT